MNTPVIPVVIIGAGPTGLTAATLLAQQDVPCVVVERWDAIYPQPRAVHLDDEVYRILARVGVADEFAAISRPCSGLRLVEPDMTVLAELRRHAGRGRHGHPQANMFDQPQLEALLRENLARYPCVSVRSGTEVTALTQGGDGPVLVEVTDRARRTSETLLAEYVLGCDGANSVARAAIGAQMIDLKFDQRWLVVDVETAAELSQWEGVHQVCDTRRAGTYMRVGPTRYRWEFRLGLDETADDYRDITVLHPLIAHLSAQLPTWLLFDSDWAFTQQSAPFMPWCRCIIAVGRVRWIPGTTMDGYDNAAWYLFDRTYKPTLTLFYGRAIAMVDDI